MKNFLLSKRESLLILIITLLLLITAINKIPRLMPFEDELIALTSHLNFLTNLSFESPFERGSGVSSNITTGINASLGGSIAWLFSKSFFYSRLFNFIWFLFIANLLKFYLFKKGFLKDRKTILILNLSYIAIPWWYEALYGLGEMISTIIFFYSVFIFKYNKKLSLVLMSISIFYGKFILIISVGVFVLFNITNVLKNIIYLLMPQIIWYGVVIYNSGLNGLGDFIVRFYNFVSFHGLLNSESKPEQNFVQDLITSEIVVWPISIKLRVIIVPLIILTFLLFDKKPNFDGFNQKLNTTFAFIILFNHIYFFFFSYKKYLRYSQATIIITLLLLIVLIDQNYQKNIKNTMLFSILFSLFLSSFTLVLLFNAVILFFYLKNKKINYSMFLVFLLLNTLNINYEFQKETIYNLNHPACSEDIQTIECGKSFLPYLDN